MELTNEFEVAVPVSHAWAVLTDVERIAPAMPGAQLKEIEGDEYRGLVKVKVGPITASYNGAARFLELDENAHRAVLKAEGRETRGQGNASATITAQLTPSGSGTAVQVTTDLNITGKVAQFGRGVLAEVSSKLLEQFVHNLETTVLAEERAQQTGEAVPAAGTGEPQESVPAASRRGRARTTTASLTDGAEAPQPPEPAEESEPAEAAEAPQPAEESQAAEAPEPQPEEPPASTRRLVDHPEPEPVDLAAVAGPSLARRLAPFASLAGVLVLLRIIIYAMKRRKR